MAALTRCEIDVAGLVLAGSGREERGVQQLFHLPRPVLARGDAPDPAGDEVGSEVDPLERGVGITAINMSTDHGRAAGRIMRVFGYRQDADLRTVRIHAVREAMGPLEELPTVVEPALTAGRFEVDLLPEVLPDIADPEVARLAVERELPWIADTECPDFGLGIRV